MQDTALEDALDTLGLKSQGCFALGAQLRAGAIVETAGLIGQTPVDLVPINAYAQYVLKLTVAMKPDAPLNATTDAVKPGATESDTVTTLDARKGTNFKPSRAHGTLRLVIIAGTLSLLALVILSFSVPGFRDFLGGWLRLLTPRPRPRPDPVPERQDPDPPRQ
jgi:hypothetical protein